MKTNILLCVFFLFFIGCDKKDANSYSGPPVPLTNTKWILVSLQNIKTSQITNIPSNVTELIQFSDSLNIFYVGGMCNGCDGKYSLVGNDSISDFGFVCTLVACLYYHWDTLLLTNLNQRFKYSLNNNQLTVYSNNTYNLNFIAKK